MTLINCDRLAKAYVNHDYVALAGGDTVCFEWGVQNADGAWFRLLREPRHTDAEINFAKRSLRNSRDVVSLKVEKLT